jgi:hypothetical protein
VDNGRRSVEKVALNTSGSQSPFRDNCPNQPTQYLTETMVENSKEYIATAPKKRDRGKRFRPDQWHLEILEAQYTLGTLRAYVASEVTFERHVETLRFRSIDEDGELTETPLARHPGGDEFRASFKEDLETAIQNLTRQSITMVVSIVEAAMTEAFALVFYQRPDTMKQLESFLPQASIEDLMAGKDLESVRILLVDRAVSAAMTGKHSSIVKRLHKATGQDLDKTTFASFQKVAQQRNWIVHENDKRDLTDEQTELAFEAGYGMVREISWALHRAKLPVLDPSNMFYPPEMNPWPPPLEIYAPDFDIP